MHAYVFPLKRKQTAYFHRRKRPQNITPELFRIRLAIGAWHSGRRYCSPLSRRLQYSQLSRRPRRYLTLSTRSTFSATLSDPKLAAKKPRGDSDPPRVSSSSTRRMTCYTLLRATVVSMCNDSASMETARFRKRNTIKEENTKY
jgi:hypothetical protein